MSTLGENIFKARKALGMTQEELARRVGYKDKSSILKIEKGVADVPQSKVVAIAHALGTTSARLMGLIDEDAQARIDSMAGAVVRMRADPRFREAVMVLYKEENEERLKKMINMLNLCSDPGLCEAMMILCGEKNEEQRNKMITMLRLMK